MASNKSSFVYYLDWAEELLILPDELRLKVDDAVKRYVLYGEEPTDREVIYSMFGLMRKQIDRDAERWEDIRGKRSHAARCKWMHMQQMQQVDAHGGVNVNVNVNDNVSTDVDNIKENNKKKSKPTLTEEEQTFVDGMTATYPHVMKMQQPLTLKQYRELNAEYSSERIKEILVAMENYKQLTSKNRSAVLTIRNWIRRDNK